MNKLKIILLGLVLLGCDYTVNTVYEEKHVLVKVWEIPPMSVHDEIAPRYKGILENGDTTPVILHVNEGDTVVYRFTHVD